MHLQVIETPELHASVHYLLWYLIQDYTLYLVALEQVQLQQKIW